MSKEEHKYIIIKSNGNVDAAGIKDVEPRLLVSEMVLDGGFSQDEIREARRQIERVCMINSNENGELN